jgi:phosphoribosylaminoimidazolecarboxamide formyltransferase/IMP cyclohydrolase
MNQPKRIKTALISVFYKENLAPIIEQLHAQGVQLLSTGGTRKFIEDLNVPCEAVEDLTSYPSILGGRVKTLHPKVFGGILTRRANESDQKEIAEFEIPEIDLVIVDLYPFEETVKSGASAEDIIEKIDIGGISLIRAAAKNFNDVIIVSSRNQYTDFLNILNEKNGETSIEDRRRFAAQAFQISSHYDTAIFNYFNQTEEIEAFKVSEENANSLRYGENPHQKGTFFGNLDEMFDKVHGKELSYNNLLDVDAAVNLIGEFTENGPTFAILKHNNACGIATRPTVLEAYEAALAGDPVSAFGGILITNQTIDKATAEAINPLFCEVVIAPAYDDDAMAILTSKKNRIILIKKEVKLPTMQYRSILNGALVQDKDLVTDKKSNFKTVTTKAPTETEKEDLEFASKLVKQTKSNAIILAKNGQLLAGGTGQTSRVDALNQAIKKAKEFNFDLNGAVMASDAFFPFPDCVEIAKGAGITAVVQPGGSIKDQLSIDYCDANDLAMVFTGTRHFKH